MGPPGLFTFATHHISPQRLVYSVRSPRSKPLLFDAISYALDLFLSLPPNASFSAMASLTTVNMRHLIDGGCRPIFVFDGAVDPTKSAMTIARKRSEPCCWPPVGVELVLRQVLDNLGIECLDAPFEADPLLAHLSGTLDAPICSHDADFFIYQGSCGLLVPSDLIDCGPFGPNGEPCVILRVLSRDRLADALKLAPEALPALAALVGHDASTSIDGNFCPVSVSKALKTIHAGSYSPTQAAWVAAANARYGREQIPAHGSTARPADFRLAAQLLHGELWFPRGCNVDLRTRFGASMSHVLRPLLSHLVERRRFSSKLVEHSPPYFEPQMFVLPALQLDLGQGSPLQKAARFLAETLPRVSEDELNALLLGAANFIWTRRAQHLFVLLMMATQLVSMADSDSSLDCLLTWNLPLTKLS